MAAVCLLHLLQCSISLWSGYFYHISHRVERQVSIFCLFDYIYCFLWYCLQLFFVGVKVCLGTSIVVVGTICIISRLVFLSFELTALILIVTWFFTMVARWSGPVRVLLWGMLRQCLWAFRLELPNHSILTPFEDATQSVHTCHFPNAPG